MWWAALRTNWLTVGARQIDQAGWVLMVRRCLYRGCQLYSRGERSSVPDSLRWCFSTLRSCNSGSFESIPAMVLFPTPPFADETAMTFFTSLMFLFCGSPRCMRGICGGAPERGRPWGATSVMEQSSHVTQTYERIFMLQRAQCREQPWLQHGFRDGMGDAEVIAEVTRIGEMKSRRLRLFCGAPSELSLLPRIL